MILPDPINNPGFPGFSSSTLESVQPFIQDIMPNTKVLTVTSGEQYWKLNLGYSDLLISEYNLLNAQIDKTLRLGEKLEVWLPQYEDYTFKLGSYQTTTIAAIGSGQVTFSTVGMQSVPKVGFMIQFANNKKVYRITDVNIQGAILTLNIYPTLRVAVPTSTIAKFTRIYFSMEFTDRSSPITGQTFTQDGFYGEGISIDLREAVL